MTLDTYHQRIEMEKISVEKPIQGFGEEIVLMDIQKKYQPYFNATCEGDDVARCINIFLPKEIVVNDLNMIRESIVFYTGIEPKINYIDKMDGILRLKTY